MFYLIKNHKKSKNYNFLNIYEKYFKTKLENDDEYIIFFNNNFEKVRGGVTLTRCDGEKNFPHLKKIDKIWVIKEIYFEVENPSIHQSNNLFEYWCSNFYMGLYESIVNFSVDQSIEEIYFNLNHEDYNDVKFFGKWPMEIITSDQNKEMFFGSILLQKQGIKYLDEKAA
jgi:hypothetical protein